VTKALSGASVTVGAGTLGTDTSVALSGQAAAAVAGAVGLSLGVPLTGAQVDALAGALQTLAGGPVTRALTGSSVTTYAGTLTVAMGTGYGTRSVSLGSTSRRPTTKGSKRWH
jgi:hypothetical protein